MSMIRSRRFSTLLVALFWSCAVGCGDPEVPGGEISIRNDILDKEYNSFRVDQVRTARGATGYSVVLKPGQKVTVPYKDVRALRFTRAYNDHAKIYEVRCPDGFNKKTTMKLIDVHSNRLAGGCQLTRRGTQETGRYVVWE